MKKSKPKSKPKSLNIEIQALVIPLQGGGIFHDMFEEPLSFTNGLDQYIIPDSMLKNKDTIPEVNHGQEEDQADPKGQS